MGSQIGCITGMASPTNGVVVWEFWEYGRWIPYDPKVTTDIERHYAKANANGIANANGVGILAVNGNQRPPALQAAGASAVSTILHLKAIDHMLGDYYVDFGTMEQIQKTPGACQYLCVDFAFPQILLVTQILK